MRILLQKVRALWAKCIDLVDIGPGRLVRKSAILSIICLVIIPASILMQYAFWRHHLTDVFEWSFKEYLMQSTDLLFGLFVGFLWRVRGDSNSMVSFLLFSNTIWFSLITLPYVFTGKSKHLIIFIVGMFLFTLWITIATMGA